MEEKYVRLRTVIDELNAIGGCDATDDFDKGWDMAVDAAVKAVEAISDDDSVSVKHGYLKKTGGYACGDVEYQCSCCGETFWEGSSYAELTHFCSNCGAKMDIY